MPIGAQLPIRQAERIEIIYGPAAALFGGDANAGVINIIIEQTNKPLYTQANLSIGADEYSNVDVMFGGKIGKNKRVLNFNFYGSATKFNIRNYPFVGTDVFRPETYVPWDVLTQNPNFKDIRSSNLSLPHESGLIGFELKYKIFKLKSEVMSRKDHSSLGLNPAAVSYSNPQNFIGERIVKSEISIEKQFNKFSFQSNLGGVQYILDRNSSTDYVENTLKRLTNIVNLNKATNPIDSVIDFPLLDSLSDGVYSTYFSGNRYSFAQSFENYIDQSINYYPFKNFEISLSMQYRIMTINPRADYYPIPGGFSPFQSIRVNQNEFTAFAQSYWTFKKINLIGGLQYYNNENFGKVISPRYSVIYKLNRNLGIRAFYGRSFRAPSYFYRSNSYYINAESVDPITHARIEYEPERTTSYELGVRWSPNQSIAADIVYYHTNTENLIAQNIILDLPTTDSIDFFFGYANFEDARTTLQGVQSSFVFKNILPDDKLNATLNITYAKGSEIIPTTNVATNNVREVPRWIIKSRLFFKPFKRWSFTTDHIFMTATKINSKVAQVISFNNSFGNLYNFDLLIRCELNRNFKIYAKVNNVLETHYAGLNATNTPDDLVYNPQRSFVFRIGMNYKMN